MKLFNPKAFLLSIISICAVFMTNSCSSLLDDEPAWYRYEGVEEMHYIKGYENTAASFVNDLNSVMHIFDQTSFTTNDIIKEVNRVVEKYDNDVISGVFSLQKSTKSANGPWKVAKTWSMNYNSRFNASVKSEEIPEASIAELGLE
ncbi:MAG: hypothetical protein ACI3ZG_00525 [Candidatus Coprenecus sp.]|nr:hypothetical protein [Candidatus Coprenecus sp.]